MIAKKAPEVFSVEITDGFFITVNPEKPRGHLVMNRAQHNILNAINGRTSSGEIASGCGFGQSTAETVIKWLEAKGMVSTNGASAVVAKKTAPCSLNVWVHTTNSCNLACPYCYIHKDKTHMSEAVMKKFGEKIIDTVRQKGLREVALRLGGGEPLLRFPAWKDYLRSLKRDLQALNCRLRIAFITNLTVLNDEIIDFIKQEKCGISVSLDGIGCYQDKTRAFPTGQGSFEIVDSHINKLINTGIKPHILIVVSENNLDGLEDLTRYILEKDLGFRFSFVRGGNMDQAKMVRVLKKCYRIAGGFIKDRGYAFSKKHQLCDISFFRPVDQPCGSGHNSMALYVNGEIHLCPMAIADNRPLGDLDQKADLLSQCHDQNQYNDLARNNACNGCRYAKLCAGGCPLDRDANGKSRYCEVFKETIPEVYRLIGLQKLSQILNK